MTTEDRTQCIVTWENVAQSGGGSDQTFQAVLNRNGTITFNYKQMEEGWSNGVIRLSNSSTVITTNLINNATSLVETNVTETKTVITNYSGHYPVLEAGPSIYTTNITVYYATTANRQAIHFTPSAGQQIITAAPLTGTVPAGETVSILITGNARSLTSNGSNSVTNETRLGFNHSGWVTNITAIATNILIGTVTTPADVIFIATNSADSAYSDPSGDQMEAMWGGNPLVTSTQNTDGSRTISWAAPDDGLSRTYNVYYTTSLTTPWTWMATVENGTGHVDNEHNEEPVIFYKVTVE